MFLQESQIIYYSSDLEYVPQTESESGYLIDFLPLNLKSLVCLL